MKKLKKGPKMFNFELLFRVWMLETLVFRMYGEECKRVVFERAAHVQRMGLPLPGPKQSQGPTKMENL